MIKPFSVKSAPVTQLLISHLLCVALILNPLLVPLSWAKDSEVKVVDPVVQAQSKQEFEELWNEYLNLLDGKVSDGQFPLDHYSLMPQKVHKKIVKKRNYDDMVDVQVDQFINWWDLSVQLISENRKKIGQKLTLENASGFQPAQKNRSAVQCEQQACTFVITRDKKNFIDLDKDVLNEFSIDVHSVATFGAYVLFVKKNSFDAKNKVQTLSFIDLERYNHMLGNEEVPVFDIPIFSEKALTKLSVQNGFAVLDDDKMILPEQLKTLSAVYDMAFNLEANALDERLLASSYELVEGVKKFLENSKVNEASLSMEKLEGVAVDMDQVHQRVRDHVELQKKLGEKTPGWKAAEMVSEEFEKAEAFKGLVGRVQARLQTGQNISVRFSKLLRGLVSPKPYASRRIKNGISVLMAGTQKMFGKPASFVLGQIAKRKWVTTGVLSSAALAYVFPESWVTLKALGLDMGHSVLSQLGDSLKGIGQAFWRSLSEVTSALNPSTFYNAYVADEKWQKLLIGLGVFGVSLIGILGGYHAFQNTYNVLKDGQSKKWKGLVARQQQIEQEYLAALGEAESEKRGLTGEAFSLEEEEEITALLQQEELNDVRPAGRLRRMFRKTKSGMKTLLSKVDLRRKQEDQSAEAKMTDKKENAGEPGISTFWQAFRHLYISYASYSKTVFQYTGIWNFYSGIRYSSMRWKYLKVGSISVPYIRPTPVLFLSRILYPKMFSTIVQDKSLPSEINEGTQPIWSSGAEKIRKWFEIHFLKDSKLQSMIQDKHLEEARLELVEVENKVIKESYSAALKATVGFVGDEKELYKLVKSGRSSSISDKGIRELRFKNKTFLRRYFDQVYEESIHRLLAPVLEKEIKEAEAVYNQRKSRRYTRAVKQILKDGYVAPKSYKDLKKHFEAIQWKGQKGSLKLSEEKIKETVEQVVSEKHEEFMDQAHRTVKRWIPSLKVITDHLKHEITGDFDPAQEGSMERYATVQKKRRDPLSMARAIRSEVSQLVVTLPLDISFYLVMAAGITEGVMKPLQETFWGPNSIGYLSQYNFYGGIALGLTMGLLANSWYKLQEDDRHDSLGNLGEVPRGADAEKSYLKWFWKMTNQRNNSLWENWKYSAKLIWHNIPAFLVNMAIFDKVFLGFFDIDVAVLGVAFGFLIPNTPFFMKIEQGFEKSVYYDAKNFPEKYLPHPKVQKYLQKKAQRRRNKFNLLFDVVRNFEGLVMKNMMVTPAGDYANRAFSRAVLGGDLLAEKIISGTQNLEEATKAIPGVSSATSGLNNICESLFNHKDVTNIPKPIDD